MNSRMITYPDTVEKSRNHTLVLIDAEIEDIARCGMFCATSVKDYDIYLYKGDLNDLQWLAAVSDRADRVLLNESSEVTITNDKRVLRIGQHQDLPDALEYLSTYDTIKEAV